MLLKMQKKSLGWLPMDLKWVKASLVGPWQTTSPMESIIRLSNRRQIEQRGWWMESTMVRPFTANLSKTNENVLFFGAVTNKQDYRMHDIFENTASSGKTKLWQIYGQHFWVCVQYTRAYNIQDFTLISPLNILY